MIVRAKPSSKPLIMTVMSGSRSLLTIYAEKAKAVSASGAFRLKPAYLWMATQGGTYEPQTLLSAVCLTGNRKPKTYHFEHLAFTGMYV